MDKWACIGCGQCCVGANISVCLPEDEARFYSNFGVEVVKVGNEFKAKFRIGTVCKHFDGRRCEIYNQRPKVCRDYPREKNGKKQCWGVHDATYKVRQ